MTRLAVVTDAKGNDGEIDHIEGDINPKKKAKTHNKHGKDEPTDVKIKRSTFTVTTKWTLARRDPEQHKKLVKGSNPPPLKKQLDRRHVISSQAMAGHYMTVLNGKLWSAAKKILDGRETSSLGLLVTKAYVRQRSPVTHGSSMT